MRILIVRAGALGDVLLLRPTLHALRSAGHSLTLLAPSAAADLLSAEVDSVIPWEGRDVAQLFAGAPTPPPPGFADHDLAVAFTRSEEMVSALQQWMPVRTRHPWPPAGVHAARWARQAVADLAVGELSLPPITVTSASRERAEPLLARLRPGFLAIHPGSGSPRKSWPPDRYRALSERLAGAERLLIVEGPADRQAAAAFDDDPRAVFACRLDLPTLGALLSRARLLIGNDSGVAHLAAAHGAPCLVLFGPTDPDQWRPMGGGVRVLRAATGNLDALSLEEVLAAARPLARSSGPELPSG